ncbi:hypothetical protein ACSBR1_007135 [Camellia fascicularis]
MASSSATRYPYPSSEIDVRDFVHDSLTRNNYKQWRQQMHNLINEQGLVGFINGTIKAPHKKDSESEHTSWKRSDNLLRKWIQTTLTEDICKEVKSCKTAKGMWTKLEKTFGHYVQLHRAAIEGNWEKANRFIEQEPHIAIRAHITAESETMLIVAVKSKRRNDFVRKLVEDGHMSPADLALGDTRKRTALHRAAGAGNMEAAKLLVRKNRYLPNAQTSDKRIPLFFAAARGHRKMVLYLLRVTTSDNDVNHLSRFLSRSLSNANHSLPSSENPNLIEDRKSKGIDDDRWNPTPFDGESGFRILHQLIISGLYDIALALLRDKPALAFFIPEKEKDLLDYHSLMAIAQKPSSFRSGASFNFFQNIISWCVPLKLENITEHNGCICSVYNVKNRFHAIFCKVIEIFVPCIKHIREKKMVHHEAHELVKFICDQNVKSNHSSVEKIFSPPLFQAISAGIPEIVEAILGSYPNAIHFRNQKKQSIFHHAVVCRRENVFNLIHQVEESKTIFLSQWDESKNNVLHLAGYLAPQQQLYLRAGAALQMQRELQWFKEVEKHVVPRNKEDRNCDKMTPAEVFTHTHKELVKEGEQWMKDKANACSIVATLIATVVFAAAITVPGGNNGDGHPIFNKRASFLIFGIFDAFALFSSITSVLLFLSILTSRYAEDDFLVTLPWRLIFGLLTLFLSILSTMIAFGATLYLVFGESYKAWIVIPVFVLPGIPVCLFVLLQSPLLLDMFKSTYCSIFFQQSHDMLY